MLAFLYGLGAMLGYGLSNAMMRESVARLGVRSTIFWRGIVSSLLLLTPFLLDVQLEPQLLVAALIGLAGYIPFWAYTRSLREGKVGVVTPIANAWVLVTVLLAWLILGEVLPWHGYAAIAAILIGIVLLSYRGGATARGVPHALVANAGWGTSFFLLRYPTAALGPFVPAFMLELGTLIGAAGARERLRKPYPRVIIIGLLAALGTLSLMAGLRIQPNIVAAIAAASPAVAALYAAFEGERLLPRQYVGVAIAIIGVIALS